MYKCKIFTQIFKVLLWFETPGGGGTLIFLYIRRLGPFFGVQNFELQYFGDFQKNEYF